jgi:hypothetical protein
MGRDPPLALGIRSAVNEALFGVADSMIVGRGAFLNAESERIVEDRHASAIGGQRDREASGLKCIQQRLHDPHRSLGECPRGVEDEGSSWNRDQAVRFTF